MNKDQPVPSVPLAPDVWGLIYFDLFDLICKNGYLEHPVTICVNTLCDQPQLECLTVNSTMDVV